MAPHRLSCVVRLSDEHAYAHEETRTLTLQLAEAGLSKDERGDLMGVRKLPERSDHITLCPGAVLLLGASDEDEEAVQVSRMLLQTERMQARQPLTELMDEVTNARQSLDQLAELATLMTQKGVQQPATLEDSDQLSRLVSELCERVSYLKMHSGQVRQTAIAKAHTARQLAEAAIHTPQLPQPALVRVYYDWKVLPEQGRLSKLLGYFVGDGDTRFLGRVHPLGSTITFLEVKEVNVDSGSE